MADSGQARPEGQVVPSDLPPPAELAQRLGDQLMQRRKALGLTQEQLAHRVGIARNQLQNIEQGYSDRAKRTPSNPRLSTLLALCRELQLTARIDVSSPSGVEVVFEVDTASGTQTARRRRCGAFCRHAPVRPSGRAGTSNAGP